MSRLALWAVVVAEIRSCSRESELGDALIKSSWSDRGIGGVGATRVFPPVEQEN